MGYDEELDNEKEIRYAKGDLEEIFIEDKQEYAKLSEVLALKKVTNLKTLNLLSRISIFML
jgi:hypothetical protein